MFSILPDLTPRDSHSLWYTSTRNPNRTPSHLDPYSSSSAGYNTDNGASGGGGLAPVASGLTPGTNGTQRSQNPHNRSATSAAIIERSILGRLRADEIYMERRRQNVANLGSTWLKPPGIPKTLFQMREERREAEEHAEALRREMLVAELNEAAEGATAGADATGMVLEGGEQTQLLGGEQVMLDEEEGAEGERDLDDEIPDADDGGFGFDGVSEEEEESEEEESEETESEEEGEETGQIEDSPRRQRCEEANRIGNMRATEDRMREMLATRGTAGRPPGGSDLYGADEEIDEEDQADMLEEDDLLQGGYDDGHGEMEEDLDMDANLDDDIPEAESPGGYEHTDSEAELSSDEDDDDQHEISYAGAGSARRRTSQQQQPQQFGRNPAHRISSSGPYALPPYQPGRTPQSQSRHQGDHHQHRGQRQYRSSLASTRDHGEGPSGPRSSLDISGLLSRDGSSVVGSSPRMRRGD